MAHVPVAFGPHLRPHPPPDTFTPPPRGYFNTGGAPGRTQLSRMTMPQQPQQPFATEPLETRALLSTVTLDHHLLLIIGDQHKSNTITVRYSHDANSVIANVNGKAYVFDHNDVNDVRIFGGNHHDVLKILQTDPVDNPFDKNVTIRGGDGDDLIVGSTESDLLTGDGGNDTIFSGLDDDNLKPNDTIYGGTGNDVIDCEGDSCLVFGGRGNDTVTGATRRGYVWGNQGNDTINMTGDRLILLGNEGNDTLTGTGRDSLYGGDGTDVLSGGSIQDPNELNHATQISNAQQVRIPTLADPTA